MMRFISFLLAAFALICVFDGVSTHELDRINSGIERCLEQPINTEQLLDQVIADHNDQEDFKKEWFEDLTFEQLLPTVTLIRRLNAFMLSFENVVEPIKYKIESLYPKLSKFEETTEDGIRMQIVFDQHFEKYSEEWKKLIAIFPKFLANIDIQVDNQDKLDKIFQRLTHYSQSKTIKLFQKRLWKHVYDKGLSMLQQLMTDSTSSDPNKMYTVLDEVIMAVIDIYYQESQGLFAMSVVHLSKIIMQMYNSKDDQKFLVSDCNEWISKCFAILQKSVLTIDDLLELKKFGMSCSRYKICHYAMPVESLAQLNQVHKAVQKINHNYHVLRYDNGKYYEGFLQPFLQIFSYNWSLHNYYTIEFIRTGLDYVFRPSTTTEFGISSENGMTQYSGDIKQMDDEDSDKLVAMFPNEFTDFSKFCQQMASIAKALKKLTLTMINNLLPTSIRKLLATMKTYEQLIADFTNCACEKFKLDSCQPTFQSGYQNKIQDILMVDYTKKEHYEAILEILKEKGLINPQDNSSDIKDIEKHKILKYVDYFESIMRQMDDICNKLDTMLQTLLKTILKSGRLDKETVTVFAGIIVEKFKFNDEKGPGIDLIYAMSSNYLNQLRSDFKRKISDKNAIDILNKFDLDNDIILYIDHILNEFSSIEENNKKNIDTMLKLRETELKNVGLEEKAVVIPLLTIVKEALPNPTSPDMPHPTTVDDPMPLPIRVDDSTSHPTEDNNPTPTTTVDDSTSATTVDNLPSTADIAASPATVDNPTSPITVDSPQSPTTVANPATLTTTDDNQTSPIKVDSPTSTNTVANPTSTATVDISTAHSITTDNPTSPTTVENPTTSPTTVENPTTSPTTVDRPTSPTTVDIPTSPITADNSASPTKLDNPTTHPTAVTNPTSPDPSDKASPPAISTRVKFFLFFVAAFIGTCAIGIARKIG